MRAALGETAPLSLRVFWALQAWTPPLLACLLAATIGDVLLRRGLPRRGFWPWLLLGSLLFAALASEAGDRLLWGTGSKPPPFVLAAPVLVLVLLLGAELGRALRSRGFVLALTAAGLLFAAARIGADAWGQARLAAYDARWEVEVAGERERARARERPVLSGTPIDGDAAPRYEAIFDALRPASSSGDGSLHQAARAAPGASIPAAALQVVRAHQEELRALREAQRLRRCALGQDFDPASVGRRNVFGVARWIGSALVVAGHERAQAGDLAGAAEEYLAAVRFGGDVAPGPLVNAMAGMSVEEAGLRALGRLVLGGKLDRSLLARIEGARSRLGATRSSLADGWRGDRLLLGRMERTLEASPEQAGLQKPLLLPWVVPYRALAAFAVTRVDPVQRRFGEALANDDLEAWTRAVAEARALAHGRLNPVLRGSLGHSSPVLLLARRGHAWFRLLQGALMIEESRLAPGSHPADPASLRLPVDPLGSGAALRWSKGPPGVRVWSVGLDGKDGGGEAANERDLVLE
jgi:hypothetical protein